MATNTSDFYTYSKTAGTAKNLQKPTVAGDTNVWGTSLNLDLDIVVAAVNAMSDLIADASQNELIDFTATGSAVNHIGITNAAAGNAPSIAAIGDDTNINLTLAPKGTGSVVLSKAAFTEITNLGTVTTCDVNGGTIDGTVIGGASAAAGTFSTLASTGNTTVGDASGDSVTVNAAAWTFANDTAVTLSGGVDALNFDSNTLSIDAANNRIGIGTAAPASTLSIEKDTGGADIAIIRALNTDSTTNYLQCFDALFPNNVGNISSGFRVGTTANAGNIGYMAFSSAGDNHADNRLSFGLHSSDNALSIRRGGNVGIAETSPDTLLTVGTNGGTSDVVQKAHFQGNSSGENNIYIGAAKSNNNATVIGWKHEGDDDPENYAYWMNYGEAPGGGLVMADGGNVGIGTTPDQLLHLKSTDEWPEILHESTHSGSGGPTIRMYHNTSSPTGDDLCGQIQFDSNDNATPTGNLTRYGEIKSVITNSASGNESGKLEFYSLFQNNNSVRMVIDGGAMEFKNPTAGQASMMTARSSNNVAPSANNGLDLGSSSYKWANIYVTTVHEGSSRDTKNTITDCELGESFINQLRPVRFRRNEGNTFKDAGKRFHFGLIAQEIEDMLAKNSIDLNDFAPLCKEKITDKNGIEPGEKGYIATDDYTLRYSQFTPLLIKAVQELSAKVTALEAK